MRRFGIAAALAALTLTACRDASQPTGPAAPSFGAGTATGAEASYIVVFRESVQDVPGTARQLAAAHGGRISHVYRHALHGFAARLPASALPELSRHPAVAWVEADQVFRITTTQTGATWGIDRIDQRNLPLSGTYTYNADGSGVRIYIIDTGIRVTHQEFGGRATGAFTSINDGWGTDDCYGHGTHVSGTAGGSTYGVAKNASLVSVRVLDCGGSGTTSGVIAGVDWVTANHVKPAVANMSLGGGISASLDAAVAGSIAAGVTYTISAGNANTNACNVSPARVATALTVGATTITDARASYSNYGSCLDLFAPGSSITSAWNTSNTATNTISGTSMAAPHAAGVAALVLQGTPLASPASVVATIVANVSGGKVTNPGTGSHSRLLYSGFITSPVPNQPPTASFTSSCTNLGCTFNGGGSSDADGTIASYAWNFGDATTGSGASVSHTYAAAGTYTVTLTVTDDDGATGTLSSSVTVMSASIVLTVTKSKVGTSNQANLSWTGAGPTVDVRRNGAFLVTVTGTSYVDIRGPHGGTFTYRVCNTGTTVCSNFVTITY